MFESAIDDGGREAKNKDKDISVTLVWKVS